jgi:CO/xanthine dehydrogenase Mo-binding subunit
VVSVAPAVANAVFHATGKRVWHLSISVEKLVYRFERLAAAIT